MLDKYKQKASQALALVNRICASVRTLKEACYLQLIGWLAFLPRSPVPFKTSVLFLLVIDCSTQKPRAWLCTLWGKVLLCVSLNSGTENEREKSYVPVWFCSLNRIKGVPRWGDPIPACKKTVALVFKSLWKPARSCPVAGKCTHSVYVEVTFVSCALQESHRIRRTATGDQQGHSVEGNQQQCYMGCFHFQL